MSDTQVKADINLPKMDPKKIRLFAVGIFSLFILFSTVYTVDANENAVILRLGFSLARAIEITPDPVPNSRSL